MSSPIDRDLLDPHVLFASCDGDAAVLARVIAALIAQLPKELAAARARFAAADASGLREQAHRLQGMISTASTAVAVVASELEDEAALGRLDGARLDQVEAMTRRLLAQLAEISIDDLLAARG